MLDVLTITGPIFLLMGLGWLAVRFGAFVSADLQVLSRYIVNFALPALIFRAVSGGQTADILNPGYLGAYLIGSAATLAAALVWARRIAGEPRGAATFHAMGMSCANSAFVGYPVLLMAFPAIASTALALNMIVETTIIIPIILILAERAQGTTRGGALARQIVLRVVGNPIILGIIAGLVVSIGHIPVPQIIAVPIDLLASSSAALSLLVIGGTLYGLPLRAADGRIAALVVGKLVAHPLAVAAGLAIMAAIGIGTGDPRLSQAAILSAAMPAMAIYPILARRYGEGEIASVAMLAMTALSFVTVNLLLLVL